MLLTSAQIKPNSFESRQNSSLFFTRGGCASCLRVYLGARLLPQSYQHPNLSEGADRVAGQLPGDKECPFSGVTKSGSLEEGAGKRCSECAADGLVCDQSTSNMFTSGSVCMTQESVHIITTEPFMFISK